MWVKKRFLDEYTYLFLSIRFLSIRVSLAVSLQQDSRTTQQPSNEHKHAVHLPNLHHQTARCHALARGSRRRGAEPGVDDVAARGAGGGAGRGSRGGGGVDALRVLRAAGVVLSAGGRAGRVGAAVLHALVVGGRADEVGDCLGVFGRVGCLAVAADAGEVEGGLEGSVVRKSEGKFYFSRLLLTGSQLFCCGVSVVFGSWRQISGQEDCCARHQLSADA